MSGSPSSSTSTRKRKRRKRGHDAKGRSTSEQFVQLPHYMLNSPAWATLSTQARAVYIELSRRYNGRNNGQIALSCRDAGKRCNINKDTAKRALDELAEKGFILRVTPGAFDYKRRHATEWALMLWPLKESEPAPKTFMSWGRKTKPGPN